MNLTPVFNGWGKDNCKTRRETSQFWDLVWLILEIWRSGFMAVIGYSCFRIYACYITLPVVTVGVSMAARDGQAPWGCQVILQQHDDICWLMHTMSALKEYITHVMYSHSVIDRKQALMLIFMKDKRCAIMLSCATNHLPYWDGMMYMPQ